MADLTQTLIEAVALLRIARTAMRKMRLEGLGSDCRLSHEVRMFALEFSSESRDGPGVLQVNGTGRALKCLEALRAALAQAEPDHETRAELAEQQVVQLAEERDHYRRLWQKAQQAEPVEAAQKSGEFRVMVCGVDCHPGDQHCNGYCTGKTDDPPEATAEQQAEPVQEPVAFDTAHAMRLADEYADLAADVRAAQGYPEHALAQDRKRMNEARGALEAYLSRQTKPKCDHCRSPLFAAVQCRVCGRKTEWVCPDAPDEKTYEQPGHCDDCGVTLVRKEKK